MIEAEYSVSSLLLYMLHDVTEIYKMIGACVTMTVLLISHFDRWIGPIDDPAIIKATYSMRNHSMFLKSCKVPFSSRLGMSDLNNVNLINVIGSLVASS